MKSYSNIPVFIPELACGHQCVFCNQQKISGQIDIPKPEDVDKIVQKYLSTLPESCIVNIAFFGGSFTGIDVNIQESYLAAAYKYLESGKVSGIRLSTRPDYISEKILDMLKKYGVLAIELGAQSASDAVLRKSGRGHTFSDIEKASKLIKTYNFELGLQMMIGLPGDTMQTSINTAKELVRLGADTTRIYPTLIIKGTLLEKLYNERKYKPLELEKAVETAKEVYKIFIENNVNVLRVGLHPSEELSYENSLVAGPYHTSFKELVLTEIWSDIFGDKLKNFHSDKNFANIEIFVNSKQINYAIGYKSSNKLKLLKVFKKVKFSVNNLLIGFESEITLNPQVKG